MCSLRVSVSRITLFENLCIDAYLVEKKTFSGRRCFILLLSINVPYFELTLPNTLHNSGTGCDGLNQSLQVHYVGESQAVVG